MRGSEKCVCCGDDIPEGRQICFRCQGKSYPADGFTQNVIKLPPDVQIVKHGRWICSEELYYNGMTKCSCCNEEYYTEDIQNLQGDLRTVNYCPNCGARMDGDEE